MPARKRPYLVSASFRPDVTIDYQAYPFNIPSVRGLPKIRFHPSITFLVGENGSGKSTVLEAIAVALGFGPEGGTKNVQFQTTHSVSPLHKALRLARAAPKPSVLPPCGKLLQRGDLYGRGWLSGGLWESLAPRAIAR